MNWPPSDPIFLDTRCRGPRCLKPLFQTLIALGDTDHAKTVPAVSPLLSKHNFMGDQRLAEIGVHRGVVDRLRRKKGHKWP